MPRPASTLLAPLKKLFETKRGKMLPLLTKLARLLPVE